MKNVSLKLSLVLIVVGAAAGSLLTIAVGEVIKRSKTFDELLPIGVFENFHFEKGSDEGVESIVIAKGDTLFLALTKDDENGVTVSLTDGSDRILIGGFFQGDRLSELIAFNNEKQATFGVYASTEPGVWDKAGYWGTNSEGELSGENFLDIDFDGNFDVLEILTEAGDLIGHAIKVGRKWTSIDMVEPLKGIASKKDGQQIRNYKFIKGSCWVEVSKESTASGN